MLKKNIIKKHKKLIFDIKTFLIYKNILKSPLENPQ
jgi:hypothetical protein